MTWGEFKAEMEKQGVKDEDEIAYIDIGRGKAEHVDIEKSPDGSWRAIS